MVGKPYRPLPHGREDNGRDPDRVCDGGVRSRPFDSLREALRVVKSRATGGALVLVLSGCGGDGVRPSMPEPDGSTTEETLRRMYAANPEFHNQYGLEQIKAHFAYARGATGDGVMLGIVDSGVDPSHPKFEGKLETSNVGGHDPDFGTCDHRAPDGTCLSLVERGTLVAGIVAAGRRASPDASAASASRDPRSRLRRPRVLGGLPRYGRNPRGHPRREPHS